jgi:GT2 family glycosyltransferase
LAIDILIPYHGNIPLLHNCLDSLLHSGPRTGSTIYLIDDASPEQFDLPFGAGAILVNRLRLEERVGFVNAINHAWSRSDGDFVIVLNSDTVPGPDLIARLVAVLEKEAEVAAVGPVSDNPRDLFQFEQHHRHPSADSLSYSFTSYLTAMCIAIRRSAIQEPWLFDPWFSPGYFEDLDLCCKLRHRGWKLAILENEHVHHEGAATFGTAPEVQAILMNNYSKFAGRWSHMPEHDTLDQLLWR